MIKCTECGYELEGHTYWLIKLEQDGGRYPEQCFCSIRCIRDWAIGVGKIYFPKLACGQGIKE